jgi:hypothetical protein
MRHTPALFSALVLAIAASVACTSTEGDDASQDSAATEDEVAKKALDALGTKVEGRAGSGNCGGCHDINNRQLIKAWAESYKSTMAVLKDETKTVDQRINSMRRNPEDPKSGFAPHKLGMLTAGAHLGTSALVRPERHKLTLEQGKVLAKLFEGKTDEYDRFKADALMPIEPIFDRLDAEGYESILQWIDKGLPRLEQLIKDEGRPTDCTDSFDGLKGHVKDVKTKSWAAVNREQRIPMFACDASGDATKCFQQQFEGKDIFPKADSTEVGKGWGGGEVAQTVRIARALEYGTFFWMRPSVDGRFVANGGGPRTDGTGAVIADLAASLKEGGPKIRDILASARYDPDFFPSNELFMFQGTSRSGVACAMSLLRKETTTKISFDEPECSKLDSISLYQTIGQTVADNSISDIFVVNSTFASDNPGLTASDKDLVPSAGPTANITIHVGIAKGNDAESGYEIKQTEKLPSPFEGDTMTSRSGYLVGSRVAGEGKALGYSIRRLQSTKTSSGYRFSMAPLGRICMPGNKANFSFDERFLITHHYLVREDFPAGAAGDTEWNKYKGKGAADIYMADLLTGKKSRISRMNPGQFAIFPHFRSDGWIYYEVRDGNTKKEYIVVSDAAIRAEAAEPTP